METKADIRKKVFRLRKEAGRTQIIRDSRTIAGRLFALPEYEQADWIYLYIDCRNEVMT